MSDLTLTLNPKLILRRAEPTQSVFIAVRFNVRTGKTLLDRGTISDTAESCKHLAETVPSQHRCVRIVKLETRVIRVYDTLPGASQLIAINDDTES